MSSVLAYYPPPQTSKNIKGYIEQPYCQKEANTSSRAIAEVRPKLSQLFGYTCIKGFIEILAYLFDRSIEVYNDLYKNQPFFFGPIIIIRNPMGNG